MNSSRRLDNLNDALAKNIITFSLGFIINYINGAFVYIFFKGEAFQRDPRYILFIHLVINDIIMLTVSVLLQILTYTVQLTFGPCCFMLLVLITTNRNTPLNLAGMAVERYIAVCRPLHHADLCTVQRAYALIGLTWTVSLLSNVTDVFVLLATRSTFGTVICYVANVYRAPYHKAKSAAMEVLQFVFVLLILAVTYLKVLFAARAVSGTDRESARNARNTILLHGAQLLICMLTFIAPVITSELVAARPKDRTNILFLSFLVANVLPRMLSPLIYGVRDQRFSQRIGLYLCCRAPGGKVKPLWSRRRSKR